MHRIIFAFVVAACGTLTVLGCGQSPQVGGNPKASSPNGPKAAASNREPPVTIESAGRHTALTIDWKKRATKVLNRIQDEQSATAAMGELTALIKEYEDLVAWGNLRKLPLAEDVKAALEKQYGVEGREVNNRYIDALKPYELMGPKSGVGKFVEQKYDISIVRMRFVKREP
jgi:hypothetical protein